MNRLTRSFVALFGTLPLLAVAQTPQSAPSVKADPAAFSLLEKAFLARQTMPADLKSLSGNVAYNVDGKVYSGEFTYAPGQAMQLKLKDAPETVTSELRAQLGSIFGHRRGGKFTDGDGKYPLTLEGTETPLGQKILLHDRMNSSYRVKGDEIIEVDRAMGGERFVVTMLENIRTPEGKTLPKHFTVSYFDEETKALFKSESVTDKYSQIDGVWLPLSRRLITAEKGEFRVKETTLTEVKVVRG